MCSSLYFIFISYMSSSLWMKNVNSNKQNIITKDEEVCKGKKKTQKINKKASHNNNISPNSHKRTRVCEFNKLLFLYSHSEKIVHMKSYAKKPFFCTVQKFVCIFVLYFDKYIYLFILYEAPFSSVCCTYIQNNNKKHHACIILLWTYLCICLF